jgi:hypothetical protein
MTAVHPVSLVLRKRLNRCTTLRIC